MPYRTVPARHGSDIEGVSDEVLKHFSKPSQQCDAVLKERVGLLTRGDPQSPLRWSCKSTRTLAAKVTNRTHRISHQKVAQLLRKLPDPPVIFQKVKKRAGRAFLPLIGYR